MKHLEEFLKRNRELAEAATPGPWSARCENTIDNHALPRHIWGDPYGWTATFTGSKDCAVPNAAFAAASRTRFPLALEMLEECVRALEKILLREEAAIRPGGQLSFSGHHAREALAALEEKAGRG